MSQLDQSRHRHRLAMTEELSSTLSIGAIRCSEALLDKLMMDDLHPQPIGKPQSHLSPRDPISRVIAITVMFASPGQRPQNQYSEVPSQKQRRRLQPPRTSGR